MNSLCYIISLFSYKYVSVIEYSENQGKKTVPSSQIIEGWANNDPLTRTRLYFIYFQTCFRLSGTGFAFDFNQRLFPFFRFRNEKLTRSNVRNKQDSNVNVDKVELKYKAV